MKFHEGRDITRELEEQEASVLPCARAAAYEERMKERSRAQEKKEPENDG
ncbi:MAG: hypothetical protein ACI4PW_00345 [Alphaproteobacteria bacterium]|jgi:hypothetical protein